MINKTIERINSYLTERNIKPNRSIPFWSWNNELDEEKLVSQIVEMKEVGVGGFIMHARSGLKTEYLGEKWFSCIDACLKKAKELGLDAWVYDENGWPSGFAGGLLLENEKYRVRFLRYSVKDYFDNDAFCIYKKTENGYSRIFGEENGLTEYHCIYLVVSPSTTDILNPEVVDEFIKVTHERYYERFKDSFGKELTGFFTDEPQFYRWATPYTHTAEKAYSDKYGEDIKDGLIYLFIHDEKGYVFRNRYFTLLNYLYVENFYKKIYKWCDDHGCKLTGHSVEESGLFMQMWGGAAVMPTYEYEHIPAIDCLARRCIGDLAPKQVSSVAAQLGKKYILTETFGCSGYDSTPRELAAIANQQYFNGINITCQHLLPYSIAGQGKYDHPPVFSKHSGWWKEFKIFNDYFAKLGYITANTTETYDVGVIHPMRGIYLDYVRSEDYESVKTIEDAFNNLLSELRKNGIRYQLIDESILERHGKINDDKLVCGKCAYDTVIIPDMRTISSSTAKLLGEYRGKLLVEGKIEYVDGQKSNVNLLSNITFDDIKQARGIKFSSPDGNCAMTSRSGEIGDFIFVINTSRTEKSKVKIDNVSENYIRLVFNDDKLTAQRITDEFTLDKFESVILVKADEKPSEEAKEEKEDVTRDFGVTSVGENTLVIDYARISFDGVDFGDKMPVQKAFDFLLRNDYKGKLWVKYTFNAEEKIPLKLMLEKGNYLFIEVNGQKVGLNESNFDFNFVEANIGDFVKPGENEIVYCSDYYQHDGVHFALFDEMATESLVNCLYYDSSVDNIYIKGDFVLSEDMTVKKRTHLPEITSENYKNGYPFFFGAFVLQGKYDYDGKGRRILSLENGRYSVAEIEVNGETFTSVLIDKVDLTEGLKKGENEVKIILKSSLRNLFGPHHYTYEVDPISVSPQTFTARILWGNGNPDCYTDDYHLVPFGLDKIEIIRK